MGSTSSRICVHPVSARESPGEGALLAMFRRIIASTGPAAGANGNAAAPIRKPDAGFPQPMASMAKDAVPIRSSIYPDRTRLSIPGQGGCPVILPRVRDSRTPATPAAESRFQIQSCDGRKGDGSNGCTERCSSSRTSQCTSASSCAIVRASAPVTSRCDDRLAATRATTSQRNRLGRCGVRTPSYFDTILEGPTDRLRPR